MDTRRRMRPTSSELVDPSRLIIAGPSDGAATRLRLCYDDAYAATLASMGVRPRAVRGLSGAEFTRQEDVYSAASKDGPATLVVQSLTDGCNLPANSSQLYNLIAGPKWFLALSDATHLGPYVGLGPAAPVVERVTVAFFDPRRIGDTSSASPSAAKATSTRCEHDHPCRLRPGLPAAALRAGSMRSAAGSSDRLTSSHRDQVVYLDHARDHADVRGGRRGDASVPDGPYGNPSGTHGVARAAQRALDDAREQLAALLGAQPGDVVFTSGGTEADNLAVSGVVFSSGIAAPLRTALRSPPAARSCAAPWSTPPCWSGVWPRRPNHRSRPSRRRRPGRSPTRVDETVRLVSVMLVNNEIGVRQPLDAVVALVRERAPGPSCTPTPCRRSAGSTSPRSPPAPASSA